MAWLQNARVTVFLNDVAQPAQADEQTGWGLGLASFGGVLPGQKAGRYRLRAVVDLHVGENEVLLFGNEPEQPAVQVLEGEFVVE